MQKDNVGGGELAVLKLNDVADLHLVPPDLFHPNVAIFI